MRIGLLLTLGLLVPGAAQAQERVTDAGILRWFQGARELGREHFRRSPTELATESVIPILNLRLHYHSEYGRDGRVLKFEARLVSLTTDTLIRAYQAVVEGDSLRMTQTQASGEQRSWSAQTMPDAIIGSQTVAAFADLVHRAGERDTVFHFWSPDLDSLLDAHITFDGDSAIIETSDLEMIAKLGPTGLVSEVSIPVQRLRTERAGTETLPPLEGITRPTPSYDAPPDAPYTAAEIRIPITPDSGEAFTLAGTLTVPKEGSPPFPAAITITGSGAQNRDEELQPLVQGYRPFRQIAERLTEEGIALLRMDDRGVGGSGGSLAGATTADLANDVRAQLAWLRSRDEIDSSRIALVGHSEGAIIAPMIAADDSLLAAIVLMAAPAKTGVEVLIDQVAWQIETARQLGEARKEKRREQAIAQVKADTANPSLWVQHFRKYDPLPTAQRVKQPTLILHGALDRQVTVGQADTLAAAMRAEGNRDVQVWIFPKLNHLFLVSPTDGSPSEYSQLVNTKVPDDVLNILAEWLSARLGGSAP